MASSGFNMKLEDLLDSLPAYVDTQKNPPFNGYWLEIRKRSPSSIQYIVRYVCDTYNSEEITIPFFERVLHKTYSFDLAFALEEMRGFLINEGLIE